MQRVKKRLLINGNRFKKNQYIYEREWDSASCLTTLYTEFILNRRILLGASKMHKEILVYLYLMIQISVGKTLVYVFILSTEQFICEVLVKVIWHLKKQNTFFLL